MSNHIAELEKALQALKESEEIMRYIVRYDPNAIAIYDCNLKYIAVSERYLQDYNVRETDIVGRHHYEVFPEMPQRWKDIHQRCLKGELLRNEDDYFERLDGSITYNRWECRPWRNMDGQIGGMITYTEVTTEKKKAELILKENEEKYRYIFANNPQPMWIYDLETTEFLEVNEAAVTHYGYSREEFMTMTLSDIRPGEEIPVLYKNNSFAASSENPPEGWRHRKKNGDIICVEIAAHSVLFEGREAKHILINDVTKRNLAEEKVMHMSRLYAMHSQINQAIVHLQDRGELFEEICKTAIHHGQFEMAWIGMIDESGKTLIPVAKAGNNDGYVHQDHYSIDKHIIGQDPIGLAIQQGKVTAVFDIGGDARMVPLKEQALKNKYRSMAAVPVRCRNKIVGAFILYANAADFFTREEKRLLQEISGEISFALTAMAIEQENKQAKEELSNSELRYRRLFESSKDGILLIDGETGIITDVNASLLQICGYPGNELLKKPVWENKFLQQLIPDHDFFMDFKDSHGQHTRELFLASKGETTINTEVVFNSYLVNNRKMIQCSLRDITKRKVAELKLEEALTEARRFRQSLDHVSSYIYMKDLQSRYIYANKHTQDLFGCTDNELTGSDDYCFFPRETASNLRKIDLRVFKGEEIREEIEINDPVKGLRVYLDVKVPIYTSEEDKTICGLLGISTDITERKLIEYRLKDSEERFRTVAQSITDVIYEWDLKNDIAWYGHIDQMMEYLPGEFPRDFEAIKKMIHPDDIDSLLNSLESIITNGHNDTVECRVKKKGGEWCIWSARRTLLKDKSGRPIKLIGSISDITERTRIKNEIKFQADLLNNVGQAVIATDNQSIVTYWNKAAEKMYGWSSMEAIGQDIVDMTPTDISKAEAQEVINEIIKGNTWSGEYIVKRKDGSSFPAYVTDSPIYDSNGKLNGIVGLSNDITERSITESKILMLSKTLEQTVDSIVITNKDGIIEYVNNSFELITGYSSQEVLGKTPRILKSNFYESTFYEKLWATILMGKVFRAEIINKRKNGELYYIEKTISPIFDQNKNITHFVGTGVDISARKQAEQELIRAKEKAEESDRLKSAFLANMSHEVRTPLNSILGFSSLLADAEFNKADRDEFIHHIIKNGNQLLNIITDIIDISKIESGVIKIEKAPVDVHKVITGIEEQFSYELKDKNLDFVVNSNDLHKDVRINADIYRLNQIFTNLVSNALKFTEKGEIEIGCLLKNKWVEFYVKDTGIGIPKEYHDKIFERFRQVETERTRKYGGNGLGLAITRNLIELMDGRIWLDSAPGIGTTFYFTLPQV